MKLDDALYNWLQIRIVADARPHDRSALDTAAFFQDILSEDHQVSDLQYKKEGDAYWLHCVTGGNETSRRYDAEAVESLLNAIQSEPRYNQ